MDFTMIGTVGSYIKQKNLNFAANYKIKTGQRVADANGNLQFAKSNMFDAMMKAQKKSVSEVDSARISSIKQKLMNGKKLSTEEMGYLREKDPQLYKKAKHADDAREELKAELKKAKTKQEARQAVTQAMMKASAEASAELAAYKSGLSAGGGVATAGYQAGQEVGGNISGVSGAEVSAENVANAESPSLVSVNEEISADGEEFSGAVAEITKIEIQANQETAENIQQANADAAETSTENNSSADKKSADTSQPANNSAGNNSPDSILEKFIMTIRALEDEWAQFTKSKTYDEMPEDYFESEEHEKVTGKKFKNNYKPLDAPKQFFDTMYPCSSKKVLDIVASYRSAMAFQSSSAK